MPVKELIIVFALISVAWAIVRMEMCYRYYYCCDTSAALNEVVKDGRLWLRVTCPVMNQNRLKIRKTAIEKQH